jgi:hypothetical protein
MRAALAEERNIDYEPVNPHYQRPKQYGGTEKGKQPGDLPEFLGRPDMVPHIVPSHFADCVGRPQDFRQKLLRLADKTDKRPKHRAGKTAEQIAEEAKSVQNQIYSSSYEERAKNFKWKKRTFAERQSE